MAVTLCEQGHYFDDVKYKGCPHCKAQEEGDKDSKTIAVFSGLPSSAAPRTEPNENPAVLLDDPKTVFFGKEHDSTHPGDGRVGATGAAGVVGLDPVVAWLVCFEGPERGRDYRVHSGQNFVGRSLKMDIAIPEDKAISRENHCAIVFDPKTQSYYLRADEGETTYLNGSRLDNIEELKDQDIIMLGDSTFVFVPFCKGEFSW